MTKVGDIKFVAELELTKFKQGMDSMLKDLDKAATKTKESNIVFKDMDKILAGIGKVGAGGMLALAGSITGLITQSSTFRQNWAMVEAQLKMTAETLGNEFEPEIEAVTGAMINLLESMEGFDYKVGPLEGMRKVFADIISDGYLDTTNKYLLAIIDNLGKLKKAKEDMATPDKTVTILTEDELKEIPYLGVPGKGGPIADIPSVRMPQSYLRRPDPDLPKYNPGGVSGFEAKGPTFGTPDIVNLQVEKLTLGDGGAAIARDIRNQFSAFR